ncbi:MAG: HAMP domain-containing sensor histidine kinase [Myxococcota bacterium]
MSLLKEPPRERQASQPGELEDLLRESAGMIMLGRVARSVTHEIANLLVGIQAEVYALPPTPDTDRANAAVELIIDRARDLLQRLLRASAGQIDAPSQLSLTEVVTPLAPLIARLTRGRIKLELDLAQAGPIEARASDLEIVLINLCMNAMEAMPSGGSLKLSTYLRPPTSMAVLEVRDTGRGIPEAQVADVFRRRASHSPAHHTGLGLAIVDTLVSEMRGTVELESSLGVGTIVRVVLPLVA